MAATVSFFGCACSEADALDAEATALKAAFPAVAAAIDSGSDDARAAAFPESTLSFFFAAAAIACTVGCTSAAS